MRPDRMVGLVNHQLAVDYVGRINTFTEILRKTLGVRG
ncbi:MAG: hypothetical protein QOI76_4317 [Frankiales bacterium]|nr:hypothetical protein [Frankiales bacterium]